MQAADKLISGGIQVPISPSYSPCDLRQIVSFLRSCFLICPWKIMWWEPRVTVKIQWHNVCKSAVSPRRCLCKGGDSRVYSWMILLSSFMMRSIPFNSAPLLEWEQEETGSGEWESQRSQLGLMWSITEKSTRGRLYTEKESSSQATCFSPLLPHHPVPAVQVFLPGQSLWAASDVVPQVPLSTYKHVYSPEPPFLK